MRILSYTTAFAVTAASAALLLAGCQKKAAEAPPAAADASAPAPAPAAAPAAAPATTTANPDRTGPGMGLQPATAAPVQK